MLLLLSRVQSCPPGSAVIEILQARTLEWVAISFSNAWKWKVKVKSLSRVQLFETPWTAAYQAPPSMGFSRQEYWSGLPLPSPKLSWGRGKADFCVSPKIGSSWDHSLSYSKWIQRGWDIPWAVGHTLCLHPPRTTALADDVKDWNFWNSAW